MRWLDSITDSIDEFEQIPEDSEGQGSLECCSPRGHKESDMTGLSDSIFVHQLYTTVCVCSA